MHGPGHAGSLSASHRPRDLHGGARILTGLAADLVIAVAARVQPGWVAPFVPGDLDGVFLEPPDKALHQTKLNKPPGDEEGREWDHNAEVSNTPAPPTPFWFHHATALPHVSPPTDAEGGYSLLAPPHLPCHPRCHRHPRGPRRRVLAPTSRPPSGAAGCSGR